MSVLSWLEAVISIGDKKHERRRRRKGSRYSGYSSFDDYDYDDDDYRGFGSSRSFRFGKYSNRRDRTEEKEREKDDGKHTFILQVPGWDGYLTKRMSMEQANAFLAQNRNILAEKVADARHPGSRMGDPSRMGRAMARAAGKAFGRTKKEEANEKSG